MSNDLLMLRGEKDGTYNLAVGEPVFLQEAFWCKPGMVRVDVGDVRYPPYGGQPELINAIRRNLKYARKHIVIANGAKQALLAALYAYSTNAYQPRTSLQHSAPYWPSYPTLAQLSGMAFTTEKDMGKAFGWPRHVRVITSPNNPDGSETLQECEIWDGAYAHWVYGCKVVPQHEVGIFSAAKMLGMSGVRVGVLTTDRDDIAELARKYVEVTTSGVANDSQARVRAVLASMEQYKDRVRQEYANARRFLLKNGETFGELISPYCIETHGVPTSKRGMFAWFKADAARMDAALTKAHVKVVPGGACGAKGFNASWYRMSMGHTPEYTQKALTALSNALCKG